MCGFLNYVVFALIWSVFARIIALNLATSTPDLLNHFITSGAKLIEYRNDR